MALRDSGVHQRTPCGSHTLFRYAGSCKRTTRCLWKETFVETDYYALTTEQVNGGKEKWTVDKRKPRNWPLERRLTWVGTAVDLNAVDENDSVGLWEGTQRLRAGRITLRTMWKNSHGFQWKRVVEDTGTNVERFTWTNGFNGRHLNARRIPPTSCRWTSIYLTRFSVFS